ncbi:AaceriAFR392Cp [[Ashbya] aceris (nom. inval.)]|nr:AaceriAFR392Cp [[Ashbya] aceris (nom. inval.)]
MSGISLSLKRKPKVKKKEEERKRKNVFNEDEVDPQKRSKILITEVSAHEATKPEKRVIVPARPGRVSIVPLKSGSEQAPSYGLTKSTEGKDAGPVETAAMVGAGALPLDQLPDLTRLEEYSEVPVEEFGAALLRGMGWDGDEEEIEGERKGQKTVLPHEQVERAEYLGIGASSDVDRSRKDARAQIEEFMPVVKVDRAKDKAADSPA